MEYEIFIKFLEDNRRSIEAGEPVNVVVKDCRNLLRKVVKAYICPDPTKLLDGEKLWIKNMREEREPNPWVIKIIEELEDSAVANFFQGSFPP